MLYHRPILSAHDFGLVRTAGPGLGNLLFPIARAVLGAHRMGGTMVRPTVRQIKFGPFLRREPDPRIYGTVFRHRSPREMMVWARAGQARQVAEGAQAETEAGAGTSHLAIRYAGLGSYFHDLAGDGGIVGRWLDTHARDRTVTDPYDIAVHVRLGDFATAGGGNENTRIALEWYADAINMACRVLGLIAPTMMLFTDGSAEELAPLRARFAMTDDPGGNALNSMRNIARARVLVASRSTFSMWGAHLGGIPAIWEATFDRSPFFPDRGNLDLLL